MRSASGNKVVLAEVTWSSRTTHSTTITINTSTTTTTIATTVTTKAAIAKESENQRSHVGDYNDCRFRCSCPYNHSCCCHHGRHRHPRCRSCCCHCQHFAFAADAATTTAISTATNAIPVRQPTDFSPPG